MDPNAHHELFQKHPSLRDTSEYVALSRNLLRMARAIGGPPTGTSGDEADAAYSYSEADDRFYQTRHEAERPSEAPGYEQARPAYRLGHLASQNPDYSGRPFELIEADLQMLWSDYLRTSPSNWESVRSYARSAYARASGGTKAVDR